MLCLYRNISLVYCLSLYAGQGTQFENEPISSGFSINDASHGPVLLDPVLIDTELDVEGKLTLSLEKSS